METGPASHTLLSIMDMVALFGMDCPPQPGGMGGAQHAKRGLIMPRTDDWNRLDVVLAPAVDDSLDRRLSLPGGGPGGPQALVGSPNMIG